MAENVVNVEIENTGISAVFYDEAFHMIKNGDPGLSLARLRAIHQHSTYEIFFVLDGALSIVTEGKTFLCEHSVAIVPPFTNHYTVAEELNACNMYFSIEELPGREGKLYEALVGELKEISILRLSDDERFYTEHILDVLSGKHPRDDIPPLTTLLFSELVHRISKMNVKMTVPSKKHGSYIHTIDAYLAAHYHENITLTDLSRELYLCEKQISRIIHKAYGCSLSDLVKRRRLSVACMLLKYTTISIGEIAASVGYAYENYFFTLFKKTYGVSPMKYRERGEK